MINVRNVAVGAALIAAFVGGGMYLAMAAPDRNGQALRAT